VYRGRCAHHQPDHTRSGTRTTKRQVYNSKRWRLTRDRYLFWNPICDTSGCNMIATDVHHRTDLDQGGDPWDLDNLQALCHQCHSIETRRRQTA
jgi:5-methylcytosine-specific restriction protein A